MYGGAEISWRDLDVRDALRNQATDWDESIYRTYLYLVLNPEWVVGGEFRLDIFDRERNPVADRFPTQIETVSLPLAVRYFSPTGIFAQLGTTFVYQDVSRQTTTVGTFSSAEGNDISILIDAGMGFRLPERRGVIALEGRNLSNQRLNFQDDSFRGLTNQAAVVSPYIPERAILGRFSFNF